MIRLYLKLNPKSEVNRKNMKKNSDFRLKMQQNLPREGRSDKWKDRFDTKIHNFFFE